MSGRTYSVARISLALAGAVLLLQSVGYPAFSEPAESEKEKDPPPAQVKNVEGNAQSVTNPQAKDKVSDSSASTPAKPPEWQRVDMRISGSMCLACLKELEQSVAKFAGINRLKIQRPKPGFYDALSPDMNNWAQAAIIFDENLISVDEVREVIRQNGYHSYRVNKSKVSGTPADKDLKI